MNSETTLVTSIMTILMPYVTKGAHEFARLAGEAAFNKAKNLFDTLKARLAEDKEASDSLNRLEEKPERYLPVVEDILKEKLTQDHALAAELEKLLKDMGLELTIIQKMKVGENVTGLEADEMTSGKTKVEQEIDQAKDVTGAKIKHIGG